MFNLLELGDEGVMDLLNFRILFLLEELDLVEDVLESHSDSAFRERKADDALLLVVCCHLLL